MSGRNSDRQTDSQTDGHKDRRPDRGLASGVRKLEVNADTSWMRNTIESFSRHTSRQTDRDRMGNRKTEWQSESESQMEFKLFLYIWFLFEWPTAIKSLKLVWYRSRVIKTCLWTCCTFILLLWKFDKKRGISFLPWQSIIPSRSKQIPSRSCPESLCSKSSRLYETWATLKELKAN